MLVVCYVPTKVTHEHNEVKPWFNDQCRHAFDLKLVAHLQWTHDCCRVYCEEFVHCQVRANETN